MRPALILICLLLALAGCRNAPAEARDELRYEVQAAPPTEHEAMRRRLTAILLGDGAVPAAEDPHLRATAAQGLGNIGDPGDADALLEALLGPLADESLQVRLECAISLGKLDYEGRRDERRSRVVDALKERLAFQRNADGFLLERQFMVRSAMLNSLIALGGRRVAIAIHDVATRLHIDMTSTDGVVMPTTSDRGLLDRCIEGLCIVTGQSRQDAAADRMARDDMGEHLREWWVRRISAMADD